MRPPPEANPLRAPRAEVAAIAGKSFVLTGTLPTLSRDAAGALLINLDNGQQWLQTSGTSSPLLEVGHEITITRAALNSFRLSTPSGRVLKVKRVL